MPDKNIFYLHELDDYKVASDDPDVRGWPMHDSLGRTIGTIDNLIVNKDLKKVVYLDVELSPDIIEAGNDSTAIPASEGIHGFVKNGNDHLIVPIGLAEVDEEKKIVVCDQVTYDTFHSAARIQKGAAIEPAYEITVFHQLTGQRLPADTAATPADFYSQPQFNTRRRKA